MDTRKRKSKDQESRVAKELSGRVTPASGAMWGAKADVRNDLFLVECKTTEKISYRLTFNVWHKIYKEAIKDGLRTPVMSIDTQNGKHKYAVICTKDLSFGELDHLVVKKNTTIKDNSSYLIKISDSDRFYLSSPKGLCYDLSLIPWSTFLEEVVPFYEKS